MICKCLGALFLFGFMLFVNSLIVLFILFTLRGLSF